MSTHNMFFSIIALCFLTCSCSTDCFRQTEGNMPSKSDIIALKQGMSQEEVRHIMGSPSVISSLDHRTWIYMNSTMERIAFLKPQELDRNVIAVEFNHDGKVERVLQLTKENGKEVQIVKDETPVLGNDQSFMEKYFGGVGYMPVQPTKSNDGL